MKLLSRAALLMLVLIPSALWAQPAGVNLIGKGLVDGTALDLSFIVPSPPPASTAEPCGHRNTVE